MSVALSAREDGRVLLVRNDALLIALAVGYGVLLLAIPAAWVVALGVWWGSNTVAHYFIHRPYFRARTLNSAFSLYLTLVLGIPQEWWRTRHLAHHFGATGGTCDVPRLLAECLLVAGLWGCLLVFVPGFFLTGYLPGYLIGLALCWMHGYYEHECGTTSHYGRLYNWLFFNDGYHVEHHRHPDAHWTRLPELRRTEVVPSRWPAVLRWLRWFSLEGLERFALRSRILQRWLVRRHEQAFRPLIAVVPPLRRVGIVGGGLFPRTALVLQRLAPEARLIIIDLNPESIRIARAMLGGEVQYIEDRYDARRVHDLDLLVFPLSFQGDRESLYRESAAPSVIIHDWIWRRRGPGAVVSWLLLKRLNLRRS